MMDWIFAIISTAAFVAFMGMVNVYVMEPDLWIVSIIVLAIGIWFIWKELMAGGSHIEGGGLDDGSRD